METKKTAKKGTGVVVVRTFSAGVHIGTLVSRDGKEVVLSNARRLWRWRGANSLHEVALTGVAKDWTRLSVAVPEITLTEAIEIIPASDAAIASFDAAGWAP